MAYISFETVTQVYELKKLTKKNSGLISKKELRESSTFKIHRRKVLRSIDSINAF